jgi:hypothetical protein
MMKNKINDGHYLELMDRLYVLTSMVDDHLAKHPLTNKLKKVRKLVDKAGMALAEAYIIVGSESYKNEKRNEPIEKVVLRRRKKSKD